VIEKGSPTAQWVRTGFWSAVAGLAIGGGIGVVWLLLASSLGDGGTIWAPVLEAARGLGVFVAAGIGALLGRELAERLNQPKTWPAMSAMACVAFAFAVGGFVAVLFLFFGP